MPRLHQAEFGLDTGMFSAHQMHPEVALRFAGSAAMDGLANHWTSLQAMITNHRTGLVIASIDVDYRNPLTFFSAPTVNTDAQVSLRDDGRLVIFRVRHSVGGQEAVVVNVTARPIKLSDGPALDALPGPVDHEIRSLFTPDELIPAATVRARYLKAQISRWVADADPIGGGDRPTFIGRNDCEFADQWLHARLPSLAAEAREQLMFDGAGDFSICVRKPIARFQGEFYRPMFFGDRGRIEVQAYRRRSNDETFFVYHVLGTLPPGAAEKDRSLCALAVEVF